MDDLDQAAVLGRNLAEAGEAIGCARGILDVIQEQGPATVHFEVEVTAVGAWLYEELDAAIFVDGFLEMGVAADDVAVADEKAEIERVRGVKHLRSNRRAVRTARRMKVCQFDRRGLLPMRAFPALGER